MPDTYNMSDVFISYSRRDADFVKKLFDDIKAREKEVWADFEDIPKAADWWKEIQAGIDAADSFIFVISPDSVSSDICRQEIDHAVANNKRFLPILHREIIEEEHKTKVHEAISSHNWIFFREADDYDAAFNTLMSSIETDLEHNRSLTRLLVRAKEWQNNNKANSYLLHGEDLNHAEQWLTEGVNKKPSPSNLHAEYIRASRQAQIKTQRQRVTLFAAGFVVSVLLAIFALYQTYQADRARDEAEFARDEAESIRLASNASELLASNNPDLALILALAAVDEDDEHQFPQTYSALTTVGYAPSTRLRMEVHSVVKSVAYSPDGTSFAAGYIDGRICIYENDGTERGCLVSVDGAAHADEVFWIHMNSDATLLLSSGADNRLVLWEISSSGFGRVVQEQKVDNLLASAMSSDGTFAIYGTNDGEIGYWNFSSNELQDFSESPEHSGAVNTITLNRDNNLALSGSSDGSVILWDVQTFEWMNEFLNPDNLTGIMSVAFSPDSSIAVAGDMNAGISAWNTDLGNLIRTFQGHNEAVTGITFSANGRTVFSSSWDNSLREWDLATGRQVNAYRGHNGGINGLSLSADNLNMVSGGYDNTLRLWHVRPPIFDRQFLTNDYPVNAVDWDERHIVTAEEDGTVLILDRHSGVILHHFPHEDGAEAIDVSLSPSGNEAFVVYRDCDVAMIRMTGELLWSRSLPRLGSEDCRFALFRPNSTEVLVGTQRQLLLLDARDSGDIGTIDYRPEGRQVSLLTAAFNLDGTQLMIGENYFEQNLRLLDVGTGAILGEFNGHTDGILSIDFNSDGSRVATGSYDNDVRVWDVSTQETVLLLEGHSGRSNTVEFSPNDDFLVSSSNDRTVRLWDLNTAFTVYIYQGHTRQVSSARFSPDGTRIITASHDSTLIIWKFPQRLEELVTWVNENRYIRELSCSEEALYIDRDLVCD